MGDFCKLFLMIQSNTNNPAAVADKFMNAKYPVNVVRLELTRLLLDSSGFRDKLPDYMVTGDNVDGIVNWIDDRVTTIHAASVPISDTKYFRRCTSFFERVFVLDWNTFANCGEFDTWFNILLNELSICEPASLHALSFAVKLKLITAYLRGASVHDNHSSMAKVKEYCKNVLANTIFYKTIQCPISAAAELYEWIKMDQSFAIDDNLKMVVWCLHMGKATLTCHALSIIYSLLRMEHLRDKLILFAHKLAIVFESMCLLANSRVLEWICRCCEFIYKYQRNAITVKLMIRLLDIMFDKDRRRAKSVAGFWISSFFHPSCHRTNIRIILEYLAGKKPELWQMVVDSLIDDYTLIIDWRQLVTILLDEDEVPEETRLTLAEKGELVTLMSYGIEEAVTGLPPAYRSVNFQRMSATQCNEYSRLATLALAPKFWDLFALEYPNKDCVHIALINCVKFFDLAIMERGILAGIVGKCLQMFEYSCQPVCFQTVIDVLRTIANKVEDDEIADMCNNRFRCMREFCESEFIQLVANYFIREDWFEHSNSVYSIGAELTLVRILAVNRVMILNQDVAYFVPLNLLWLKKKPISAVFLCMLYVSAALLGQYASHTVDFYCELREEELNSTEHDENFMCEMNIICKILVVMMKELCPWSNVGQAMFFSLIKVVDALRLVPFSPDTWNVLLPQSAQRLIAGYVASMVWKEDPEWAPALGLADSARLWIFDGLLKLIEWRVLPLYYAYDAFTSFHTKPAATEKPLREFILNICAAEDQTVVVGWLVQWMTFVFRLSVQASLATVKNFVELIFPIRSQMQKIICEVILKGVEFAVSKRGQQPNHKFLDILANLGECLDASNKTAVEKQMKRASYHRNDVKAVESFIKRMKKKIRKVEKPTDDGSDPSKVSSPILSSQRSSYITFDEKLPAFSPSSDSRSSSMLADESDLDSSISDLRLRITSFEGSFTKRLVGILPDDLFDEVPNKSSISAEELDARAGPSGKSSQVEERPSGSASGLISDIFTNPPASSTRLTELAAFDVSRIVSNLNLSFTGAPIVDGKVMDLSVPSTSNASNVEEDLLQMLSDMSQSASESSSESGTVDGKKNAAKPSTKAKKSQARNKKKPRTFHYTLDELRGIIQDERANAEGPFVFGSKASDLANIPPFLLKQSDAQTESTSQALENVSESQQAVQIPSPADRAVTKSPSVSASSEEDPDTARKPSSLTTSPKEPDTRTENTSQLENVNKILQRMQISSPDIPAVATSPPEAALSGEALDTAENPSLSTTQPQEPDAQSENTSRVSDNANDFLQGMEISSPDNRAVTMSPPVATFSGEALDTEENSSSSTTQPDEPDARSENTSRIMDNANEFLQDRQVSSPEDDTMSTISALSESSGNAADIAEIPSEPDTQIENTSEAFDTVTDLLKIQAAATDDHTTTESSTISTSSGDGPNISPSPRPIDIAPTESLRQVYDEVDNMLKIQTDTTDETRSTTESSGEFAVYDSIRNQSILSDSPKESDDQADSTSQTFGSYGELMKNLKPSNLDEYAVAKSPSESEISESNVSMNVDPTDLSVSSAESGERISVVKNLSRGLSNPEMESSESSSSAFETSPQKKKRRKS